MDLQAVNMAHPDDMQRRRKRSDIKHFMGRLLVKVAGPGMVHCTNLTIWRWKNNSVEEGKLSKDRSHGESRAGSPDELVACRTSFPLHQGRVPVYNRI